MTSGPPQGRWDNFDNKGRELELFFPVMFLHLSLSPVTTWSKINLNLSIAEIGSCIFPKCGQWKFHGMNKFCRIRPILSTFIVFKITLIYISLHFTLDFFKACQYAKFTYSFHVASQKKPFMEKVHYFTSCKNLLMLIGHILNY